VLRATLAMCRALAWLHLRRPVRALAVLDRALSRGAHGSLLRHRASTLALLGRREEAVEAYREALRFDPLDGTTRIEAVQTLFGWGWEHGQLQAFVTQFDTEGSSGGQNSSGPAA
jgi:tetratricopeptide (TPR) repeat protein